MFKFWIGGSRDNEDGILTLNGPCQLRFYVLHDGSSSFFSIPVLKYPGKEQHNMRKGLFGSDLQLTWSIITGKSRQALKAPHLWSRAAQESGSLQIIVRSNENKCLSPCLLVRCQLFSTLTLLRTPPTEGMVLLTVD